MKLSEIVLQYREKYGLSMRTFAGRCGLSHAVIANIEKETNSQGEPFTPTIDTLSKIAKGMGISLNDLLAEMDDIDVYVSETDELRDMLKENSDMRMLLSISSKFDKEDFDILLQTAKAIGRRYED